MNNPTTSKLADLVFQLRIRTQRSAMIEKIAEIYGRQKADDVKNVVIERFKQGRGYNDYGACKPLFIVGDMKPDEELEDIKGIVNGSV